MVDVDDKQSPIWGDGPGGSQLWKLILEAFARTADG